MLDVERIKKQRQTENIFNLLEIYWFTYNPIGAYYSIKKNGITYSIPLDYYDNAEQQLMAKRINDVLKRK